MQRKLKYMWFKKKRRYTHTPEPCRDWDLELRVRKLECPQKKNVGDSVNTSYYEYGSSYACSGVIVKIEDMQWNAGPGISHRYIKDRMYWVWNAKTKELNIIPEGCI